MIGLGARFVAVCLVIAWLFRYAPTTFFRTEPWAKGVLQNMELPFLMLIGYLGIVVGGPGVPAFERVALATRVNLVSTRREVE